jgi:hypothetical protein
LRGISPLIWRRLLVRADTSIAELHHILQLVMGWTNSHLHRFVIHGKEYGIAYDGGLGFDDDPRQIRLRDFQFRQRERFVYEYDFGDNWQHDVRIEQILTAEGNRTYPVCIGGKRAVPPAECVGVEVYLAQGRRWKYDFLCHRLRGDGIDREHDCHVDDEGEELDEPGYDPDQFDRREVNAQWRRWGARGGDYEGASTASH